MVLVKNLISLFSAKKAKKKDRKQAILDYKNINLIRKVHIWQIIRLELFLESG